MINTLLIEPLTLMLLLLR